MKTRVGFVSNSSSSSFLIYGISIEVFQDFPKIIEAYKKKENIKDDDIDNYELQEFVEEETGLECHNPYDEGVYIGKSWHSIKDDQTGKQFKEEIENKLKDFFGNEIECCTLEEAWRDS